MKKGLLLFTLILFQISYSQIVTIPDVNFKAALIEQGVDTNGDGEIQVSEAENVTEIDVRDENISSLEGIQNFINLIELNCYNNNLTSIDLSNNTALENLDFEYNMIASVDLSNNILLDRINFRNNELTSIDVSNNTLITHLYFDFNEVTSIDVSQNTALETLRCADNQLTTIDVSNNLSLKALICSTNNLTSIDISQNTELSTLACSNNNINSLNLTNNLKLSSLYCYNMGLTSLDISQNTDLKWVRCRNNQITSLDFSNAPELISLYAHNNNLEYLNLKNGSEISYITIDYNPNLEYICVDSSERSFIQERLDTYGYTDCVVNTFCTFEPGGEVYYIQGNVKVDVDQDGCDSDDIGFPFMQFVVTDTNGNSGTFSSELDGSYNIPLPEGDYTINYQFPYMSYFSISPASVSVNFPADTSPVTQDICLTPNGTYNDLQVVIIPLEEARSGFDARYKIIYANVGTTPLSGNVQFIFQDDVLDYVSSSVSPDTQNTGELNWSFSNLTPLEFKFIEVTMNLNAPTETPPLNGGEILCYDALITPVTNDQREDDNSFTLKQTVVNSYDPNDKTCLEGNTVTPDLIGEYVHYLIRFENTGTASAINVVVKDVIDTAKFDISSLVIYDSSHDMVTRIQNTNEVEFIFEGINLPFDDATNDGYVAFKIKTLPSLVVGDTFENNAEIYFDFNFPIITNTEQTTIETTASVDEFSLNANISVFPNPTNDLINIQSTLTFDSITIYDLKGRQLQTISITLPQLTKQIDVSNLASGIYYVSVQSGKSKKLLKIIRE